MIHLGDITKINGGTAPVVDAVIGGSPCQDLSIAGKRAGLSGERSGLYMEQIRVTREMREHDRANGRSGEFIRPRFMVWENVPGAFSSNHGKDFAAVLEEAVRIVEPEAPLFLCLKRDGQPADASWETDGALLGEFSMRSFGESPRHGVESYLSQILEDSPHQKYYLSAKACRGILNRAARRGKDLPEALKAALLMQSESGGGCDGGGKGALVQEEKSGTLGCNNDQIVFCNSTSAGFSASMGAKAWNLVCAVDCRNGTENPETNGTLQAKSTGGQSLNLNNVVREAMTVRRLTPLECERLQGFPDGWTGIGGWVDSKGKTRKTTDSARYKALGNSIALPPWKWVLKRICAQYERDATMASLFDGIGGFPLIWEQLNGKGSCLWASEIEEFPMAVTRKHFG